jgi:hypothetical protein
MKIVIGRGKNRKVQELPHGSLIMAAAKSKDSDDSRAYYALHANVCETLGVKHQTPGRFR